MRPKLGRIFYGSIINVGVRLIARPLILFLNKPLQIIARKARKPAVMPAFLLMGNP